MDEVDDFIKVSSESFEGSSDTMSEPGLKEPEVESLLEENIASKAATEKSKKQKQAAKSAKCAKASKASKTSTKTSEIGHFGVLIGRGVEKCLKDWEIKNVMALTVDNASSNDVVVCHLKKTIKHWGTGVLDGKYLHMRCVAHILNLVVKDGLKDKNPSISKIRSLVRYIRSSPTRLQKFKECMEEEVIDSKSLVSLDVDTRWNSTYLMLISAVKFKKAFDNLLMKDSSRIREVKKLGDVPKDDDWEIVNNFLHVLKVFYDATLTLSSSRYVTCNIWVKQVFSIGLAISKLCTDSDEFIKKMATQINLKYDKYWGSSANINHMLFIVVLLDPRCNMAIVEWILKNCFDVVSVQLLTLHVKLLIEDLFNAYSLSMPEISNKTAVDSSSTSTLNMKDSQNVGVVMDFDLLLTSSYQSDLGVDDSDLNKTQLDIYLAESRHSESANFDVLKWWKQNQIRYPILSKIARDVLALPVTTIAS